VSTATLVGGDSGVASGATDPTAVPNSPAVGDVSQATASDPTPAADELQAKAPAEDAGKDGEATAPAKQAPEKYEFTAPEGSGMDADGLAAFGELARDMDLSQEAAQKMVDKMAPAMQARQQAAVERNSTAWADAARADKEYGGEKLDASLATAKKALTQFGTPELQSLLNDSRLGNHPEMIRFMVRAGAAISEDRMVTGGAGPAATQNTAKTLYPNQS